MSYYENRLRELRRESNFVKNLKATISDDGYNLLTTKVSAEIKILLEEWVEDKLKHLPSLTVKDKDSLISKVKSEIISYLDCREEDINDYYVTKLINGWLEKQNKDYVLAVLKSITPKQRTASIVPFVELLKERVVN